MNDERVWMGGGTDGDGSKSGYKEWHRYQEQDEVYLENRVTPWRLQVTTDGNEQKSASPNDMPRVTFTRRRGKKQKDFLTRNQLAR